MGRFAFLLLLLVLLAIPEPTRAEEPASLDADREAMDRLRREQRSIVRRLLRSGDDRALAWGATWARELSLVDLVPELMIVLRREAKDEEAVGYYGMLAVFDALLHLGARAETEDLLPFRIEVRLEVVVRDDDEFRGRGGRRDLGIGHGHGRLPEREGYPPIWRYELSRYPRDGHTVLVEGPTPIYVGRNLARRGFGGTSRHPQDRNDHRFDWLAELVDSWVDRLPLRTGHGITVMWKDGSPFLAEVDAGRAKVQGAFAELLALLETHGALSADEGRRAKLLAQVEVQDLRVDTSAPVPPVPAPER